MSLEVQRELKGKLGTLRGIVHHPNCARVQQQGIAVLLHGYFSCNRTGPARLYVHLGRSLSEAGFAVWRFDCYGIGDSDGEFEEASYTSEMNDYLDILHTALLEAPTPDTPIVLVGHSMGAGIALRLASTEPRISRLALISPTLGALSWPDNIMSHSTRDDLAKAGVIVRKGFPISASFFADIHSDTILEISRHITTPIDIFYGSKDQYYSRQHIELLAGLMRAECVTIIADADHNFLCARESLIKSFSRRVSNWRLTSHGF